MIRGSICQNGGNSKWPPKFFSEFKEYHYQCYQSINNWYKMVFNSAEFKLMKLTRSYDIKGLKLAKIQNGRHFTGELQK